MSDIGLDLVFTRIVVATVTGAVAAVICTPVLWRLAAGLPRFRRLTLAALGALGLAALAVAVLAFEYRDPEMPAFTMVTALLLQVLVLPVIFLFSRKGP